jgi:transposase InsO family protein
VPPVKREADEGDLGGPAGISISLNYKTEEIYRRGPWKGVEDVEFATLEWVAWYNTRRLLAPLGYVSPDDFERAYRHQSTSTELVTLT